MSRRKTTRIIVSVALAACLGQPAIAKPPDRDFERAEEAAERAEEAAERASERAAERAERAAERAEKIAEKASERAERAAERAEKNAEKASERAERDADRAAERAAERAASDPDRHREDRPGRQRVENAAGTGGTVDTAAAAGDTPGVSAKAAEDLADARRDAREDVEDAHADGFEDIQDARDDLREARGGSPEDVAEAREDLADAIADAAEDLRDAEADAQEDIQDALEDYADDLADDDRESRVEGVEFDEAGNPYREDEFVVLSADDQLVERAGALGFGVISVEPLTALGDSVARLRKPRGMSSSRALELLRSEEPDSPSGYNYLYRPSGAGLALTNPVAAAGPGRAQAIAVIDGFRADAISGWPVERRVDASARAGHGDDVTAILLGELSATHSTAPASLHLLDVVAPAPGGPAADVAALVGALDRAVSADVGIINMSLSGPAHPALSQAIAGAQAGGASIVAAVGNGGPAARPTYPAAYEGVIGVGAVDGNGRPYVYSGRGEMVDIMAPGVDLTVPGSSEALLSGTSYAAPYVSAFLAARLSLAPGASAEGLLAAHARDAGVPGRDPVYGLGILQAPLPRLIQVSTKEN